MFATNAPIGFNDEAYSNAALDKTTNPVGDVHSALDGFAASIMAPELGIAEFGASLQGKAAQANPQLAPFLQTPADVSGAHTLYNQLNDTASQNSISGDIGSVAGFALNPLNWVTGGMGGSLADGFASAGARILPGLAAKTPAIVGMASKAAISGAVSLLPSTIPGGYNPSTNSIDWGGVAKSTGYGVGMGMALGAGLVGLGIAGGKAYAFVKAKNDAEPMADNTGSESGVNPQETEENQQTQPGPQNGQNLSQSDYDDALNAKAITPDEHGVLTAKLNGVDNQTLQALGSKVAAKNGVNGDVNITFLKPSDLQNLSTIAGDGLAADIAPELKSALSDYVLNQNIDAIRQDPVKMAALQGFSDHMEGRLAHQADELGQLDQEANQMKSASLPPEQEIKLLNAVRQDHLENVKNEMQKLGSPTIQAMKDSEGKWVALEGSHRLTAAKELGIIPKVEEVMQSTPNEDKEMFLKSFGNANARRVPLKLRFGEDITPEIDNLREKLTQPNITRDNLYYKDYKRLSQLAIDNPYAEAVLNRVNQGAKYNEQSAFKTIADNLLEMNKQGIAPQAALDKVQDYLKARNGSKVKLIKDEPALTNEAPKVVKPEDIKAQIDDLEQQGHESNDFEAAQNNFNIAQKFRSGVSHLADLAHCVFGGE